MRLEFHSQSNARPLGAWLGRARSGLRLAGTGLLAGGFLWALYCYGAAETVELFRFFLLSLSGLLLLMLGAALPEAGQPHRGDSNAHGPAEATPSGSPGTGRDLEPSGSGPADWPLLLLLLWGAVLVAGAAWQTTLPARGYALFGLGWIALVAVLDLSRTARGRRRCLFFLVSVGVAQGVIGLAQIVRPESTLSAATGTLFNQNHYAGLMNMLFGLALGFLFALHFRPSAPLSDSEKLAQSWIAALACGLIGVPVLLSRSRAGAVILLLLVALALGLTLLGRRRGRYRAAALLLLVLAMTLGVGSLLGLDTLARKFQTAGTSLEQRMEVYADTLRLIAEHPWKGVGPMNYEWRFRPYQSAQGRVWYDYAHNDYLQVIAEWGVPLGLCLWGFVLWRFWRGVSLFLSAEDGWRRGLALGCLLAVFSILLHSLVDFNLYIPANQAVFWAIIALGWALDRNPRG